MKIIEKGGMKFIKMTNKEHDEILSKGGFNHEFIRAFKGNVYYNAEEIKKKEEGK